MSSMDPQQNFNQQSPQGPSGQVVAPRNPALYLIISAILPGLGSLLNGETTNGTIILVGWVVSWVLTLVFIGFFGLLAFWVWGLVDAYTSAQKWNAQHGIIS